MLDTVRLESPFITEELASAVEPALQLRQAVELGTGAVVYSFTSGELDGSFDTRVHLEVRRYRWEVVREPPAIQVPTAPYLVLEGSVHKALMGHNVEGGPLDPVAACRWFVSDVGRRLGVELPPADEWAPKRVDWAEVYDLGSYEAVQEYMERLAAARFPRREKGGKGSKSVSFNGVTTGIMIYHKGPEFRANGRKRWPRDEVECLQARADALLRFEVRALRRKLDQDGRKRVTDLSREYLEAMYDRESFRLVREGQADMETVRTHREVNERLKAVYAPELANRLFGTWLQLSALGEDVVRRELKRTTFYRQRSQLQAAGVQWLGSDVRILSKVSLVPEGFAPLRADVRRLTDEAPQVREALQRYRAAA